jgi:hypothetical protein
MDDDDNVLDDDDDVGGNDNGRVNKRRRFASPYATTTMKITSVQRVRIDPMTRPSARMGGGGGGMMMDDEMPEWLTASTIVDMISRLDGMKDNFMKIMVCVMDMELPIMMTVLDMRVHIFDCSMAD